MTRDSYDNDSLDVIMVIMLDSPAAASLCTFVEFFDLKFSQKIEGSACQWNFRVFILIVGLLCDKRLRGLCYPCYY